MSLKFRNILIFILLIFVMSGCKNNTTETVNPTKESVKQTNIQEDYVPINPEDCVFVADTDAQPNIGQYPTRAYTDRGYYYLFKSYDNGNMVRLFFHDYATGRDVIVCSKIDCSHDSAECDAYFEDENYSDNMSYQNDTLYFLKREEGYQKVEAISPDGTERRTSCTMLRVVVESDKVQGYRSFAKTSVHRGYAYFSTFEPGNSTAELYRVRLDSDEQPELLCSTGKEGGNVVMLYRIKPYGKYVFFQMGESGDGGYNYENSIYAYNTENGEITLVCKGAQRDYMVMGDSLYYFDMQDNIHRMKLQTGVSELFWENDREIESNKMFGNNGYIIHELEDVEYRDTESGEIKWHDIQIVIDENGETVKILDSLKDEMLPEYVIE